MEGTHSTICECDESVEMRRAAGSSAPACSACASEKARADQLGINCRWLIAQLDAIHAALCPDHIGTWQERAQAAVKAAQAMTQNARPHEPSESEVS